jgi:hypothetical protein
MTAARRTASECRGPLPNDARLPSFSDLTRQLRVTTRTAILTYNAAHYRLQVHHPRQECGRCVYSLR